MIIINSFRFLAIILLVIILIVKELPFKELFKDETNKPEIANGLFHFTNYTSKESIV